MACRHSKYFRSRRIELSEGFIPGLCTCGQFFSPFIGTKKNCPSCVQVVGKSCSSINSSPSTALNHNLDNVLLSCNNAFVILFLEPLKNLHS